MSLPSPQQLKAPGMLIPLLVLLLTLLATGASGYYLAQTLRQKDKARFENAVQRTEDAIAERVNIYVGLLRGGTALLAANENVARDEFRAYVDRLLLTQHYPGIQGFGFAKRVLPGERDPFVSSIRKQIGPAFNIKPAGEREEYFPIIYLEPLDVRNREAIGYDMFSEPVRREAMAKARDQGKRAASGKVTLVQEIYEKKQAGFLIYVPAYRGGVIPETVEERRKQIVGFIYSPFRADDLFAGIFQSETQPRLHFEVYDGAQALPESVLHRSSAKPSAHPQFSLKRTLAIAGRPWTVVFFTTPEFEQASSEMWVPWVILCGAILSLILFGITNALANAEAALSRAQAELVKHAQELEQTVAERTSQLRETIAELESFSYSVSHDLRAPLRAMQSFAQALQEEFGGKLGEEGNFYISKIVSSGARLDRLIQDVLTYSRVVREQQRLEPVNVDKLTREIIQHYPNLQEPHAMVKIEGSLPSVIGNEALLTQCIANLLGNAVKFVRKDEKPVVSISGESLDGRVRLRIKDNGIGIPARHQHLIFQMFERIHGDREYEGTGIGLAIVRKAVERMGGEAGVESQEGKGSTFWFTLRKEE